MEDTSKNCISACTASFVSQTSPCPAPPLLNMPPDKGLSGR